MGPQQKELLSLPSSPAGSVFVSDRVSFRTEGTQRVIIVHGVVFANYAVEDRAAEAYAMITLSESGSASQIQIARSFGYSVRSLRRYQERFQTGGVGALVRGPGRPMGDSLGHSKQRGRDETILHLKAKGSSNRAIAGKLALSETAIRKRLRRLGWQPIAESTEAGLPFQGESEKNVDTAAADNSEKTVEIPRSEPTVMAQRPLDSSTDSRIEPPPTSRDLDPLDRSMDRLLAAMGLLEAPRPGSDSIRGRRWPSCALA